MSYSSTVINGDWFIRCNNLTVRQHAVSLYAYTLASMTVTSAQSKSKCERLIRLQWYFCIKQHRKLFINSDLNFTLSETS